MLTDVDEPELDVFTVVDELEADVEDVVVIELPPPCVLLTPEDVLEPEPALVPEEVGP